MNNNQVENHICNPYRFEETEKQLGAFSRSQHLPLSWGMKGLKWAWAFQGLMQKPLNKFDSDKKYMVYVYEPFLTLFETTLQKAIEDHDGGFKDFHYNPNIEGHLAVVHVSGKYCSLSRGERRSFLRKGKMVDETRCIIDLDDALEIAGDAIGDNFRIISKIGTETDIFSALCTAFEVPETCDEYYPRNVFRAVYRDNQKLHNIAEEWLENWVEDDSIKTHLSCFMEKNYEHRGRFDIILSNHYHEKWAAVRDGFPGGLRVLSAIGAKCLLGWEWEYIDLIESKALVAVG